jgi:flavodoxin
VKSAVIYDSEFGNTAAIAEAVAEGLGEHANQVFIYHVKEFQPEVLQDLTILAAGSPTQKFSPTPGINSWLGSLPRRSLTGVQAAAFDTRFTQEKIQENKVLAFFVSLFGYAARPMARALSRKGARTVLPPEGFYVGDLEGPLLEDELDRAREWGRQILERVQEGKEHPRS